MNWDFLILENVGFNLSRLYGIVGDLIETQSHCQGWDGSKNDYKLNCFSAFRPRLKLPEYSAGDTAYNIIE